jgi:hypothetical protein
MGKRIGEEKENREEEKDERGEEDEKEEEENLSGLLVVAKKCIQIEDQLYAVLTAKDKARTPSTAATPRFLSHYPIRKVLMQSG